MCGRTTEVVNVKIVGKYQYKLEFKLKISDNQPLAKNIRR